MPNGKNTDEEPTEAVEIERRSLQQRLSEWLDLPLTILAVIWVALLVIELALALPPDLTDRIVKIDFTIWLIFVADFLIEFTLAPDKLSYVRSNSLALLSIVLPFARIARLAVVVRVLRPVSLVRITLITNRATQAIGDIFSEHGLKYVLALTVIVTFVGAAAVFFFERGVAGSQFTSLGDALWWTVTMVTTINIGFDPVTFEGRVIAVMLRVYAMGIFGYIAASIASYLIGRRVVEGRERRGEREAIERLTRDVERLSRALDRLETYYRARNRSDGGGSR